MNHRGKGKREKPAISAMLFNELALHIWFPFVSLCCSRTQGTGLNGVDSRTQTAMEAGHNNSPEAGVLRQKPHNSFVIVNHDYAGDAI